VGDSIRLYGRLVHAQIRSQLQYRVSFTLDVAGMFLISFLDFVAVLVIFHNIPQLSGWSLREIAFLYAVSAISFNLTDLAIGHLDLFPRMIRDGAFDTLLVRPRGTLFQVFASDFALRRVGKAVQGVFVLGYALDGLEIAWNAGRVAMFAVMVAAGILIFGSVWVAGSCIAFWTTEGGEFTNAFTYGGNFLTQYPIDIYSVWARRFLAYLVPMAFVCYFPSLYILDKPDPLGLPRVLQFLSPLVAVAAACVAGAVWRAAVRRYRSVGS
jgi:ABC-2 type transport system permease protein